MKKERLQQTMQRYKESQETIMSNYMPIKRQPIFTPKTTGKRKTKHTQN